MDLTIRPIAPDEWPEWIVSDYLAFGLHGDLAEIEGGVRPISEVDRAFGVFDDGRIVGTSAAFSFQMTVPGGVAMPTAGVTGVGVHPTHRRRGLLSNLMRLIVDQAHERGEPLASLYASESVIYGRFGYGVATYDGWYAIDRHRASLHRSPSGEGRLRLVGKDEALARMPEAYDRGRLDAPGVIARNADWWRYVLWEFERDREGFSANFYCLYERGDRTEGYVVYQLKQDWTGGLPAHTLAVKELLAATDDAYLALWQFCFDVDLVATVQARLRPHDEPLRHLLTDPRRLRTTAVSDGLWMRLVDLPAALAGRRYAVAGRLVLDVADPFCPWNEGRWVLEGGPDGAECRPAGGGDADLACTSTELASAFLGGVRLGLLARAGRVDERVPGALARADAMFGHDPLPHGTTAF